MRTSLMTFVCVFIAVLCSSCGNSGDKQTAKGEAKPKAVVQASQTAEADGTIPVYLWECHYCGMQVEGIDKPTTLYCPENTYHLWTKMS